MERTYHTRALLDSGSNRSFCTERLAQTLEVEGSYVTLTWDNIDGENSGVVREVNLQVRGVGMKWSRALYLYKVIVKRDLPLSLSAAAAMKQDITTWSHLQGIEGPSTRGHDKRVELLIGLDYPEASEPLEVRRGR